MRVALRLLAAVAVLAPSAALACPYGAAASDCAASGSSLFGYGASLLVGLGAGFASIALERRRS